jgi:hypothetical protein
LIVAPYVVFHDALSSMLSAILNVCDDDTAALFG